MSCNFDLVNDQYVVEEMWHGHLQYVVKEMSHGHLKHKCLLNCLFKTDVTLATEIKLLYNSFRQHSQKLHTTATKDSL